MFSTMPPSPTRGSLVPVVTETFSNWSKSYHRVERPPIDRSVTSTPSSTNELSTSAAPGPTRNICVPLSLPPEFTDAVSTPGAIAAIAHGSRAVGISSSSPRSRCMLGEKPVPASIGGSAVTVIASPGMVDIWNCTAVARPTTMARPLWLSGANPTSSTLAP